MIYPFSVKAIKIKPSIELEISFGPPLTMVIHEKCCWLRRCLVGCWLTKWPLRSTKISERYWYISWRYMQRISDFKIVSLRFKWAASVSTEHSLWTIPCSRHVIFGVRSNSVASQGLTWDPNIYRSKFVSVYVDILPDVSFFVNLA